MTDFDNPRLTQAAASRCYPELELLLAAARWPFGGDDRELVRELAGGSLDWDRFVPLVKHHRVVPLVSRNLQSSLSGCGSPGAQRAVEELRGSSAESALESLRLLAELRRVLTALETVNIRSSVLKGLVLAQSVFGDLSLRSPGDLDLLIDESGVMKAHAVLRRLGYRGLYNMDRFSPRQFDFYRKHWKDLAYENPANGIALDLHWRCFRNREMPGSALCDGMARDEVSFGGFRVETLPQPEGLLYLCVHGTLDGWIYLKSLVDVAAQVRTMDEPVLDNVVQLASVHSILPELTATLVLVRRYFGMRCWSAGLLPETHPGVRHILRYVGETREKRGFTAEREAIPIGTTLAFEFGLRSGLRYKRELLLRILFRARMWQTIPLPDFLFWSYPLLSPLEWLLFRARRGDRNRESDAVHAG